MSARISPLAGQPAQAAQRVDVSKLVDAYYSRRPDPEVPSQRVAFGTSGHRGSSFDASFNEAYVLAISQAICLYRQGQGIDGPLFIGIDTHALSVSAFESALEVLAAKGVDVMITKGGEESAGVSFSRIDGSVGRLPRTVSCRHCCRRRSSRAPGNDAPIGGIKVVTASGWFAARPSGTEDIYKIYAESFRNEEHLRSLLSEAQAIVDRALTEH
ncbi:MAG: hypothetical protein KJ587_13895 [Alphaproteobacteria bacterium]|nr:hypothetical protein [Alphaproteobacteria bacterium]